MRRYFAHIGAVVLSALFLLACQEEEIPLDSVTLKPGKTELEAAEGSIFVSVTASGSWTLELEFKDGLQPWASVTPSEGSGQRGDVRLRYETNESNNPRTLTLTATPARGTKASVTITQAGAGGQIAVGGEDVARAGWLEIPATKAGDGRSFFVHDMTGGKYVNAQSSGVRNWSFYWDSAEHLSLWVAYPLNPKLRGNGSRSNAWGLDPLLPASAQPDITRGSYGGGWARGHQLPSADRLTYAANVSTFYATNMTPQQYDFNGGIWANLENRVRSYSDLSDTLYVVTGCLFDASDNYSGTSSGFAVKIPTHYFKALLYKGVSTYATDGYMAAGYLLPHDASIAKGNYLNYISSIDNLEKATGIDFFPNLESVIGKAKADAIEAEEPSKWWK